MSENTAMTFAQRHDAIVAENKERNAMVTAIRGTIWSKDLSEGQMRSIAHYCHKNGMDPIRHIEVLGGRIYPTATLYEERAAPFIRAGVLIPHEPQFINVDDRLDALAEAGDEWAIAERAERMRLRIKYRAPEKADAIAVYRITIAATGQTVVGVNWCGKGLRVESKEVWAYDPASGKRKPTGKFEDKDMDPVGGNEPTKTAITRAGRRAWKQIVEAVEGYGAQFAQIESEGEEIAEAIVEEHVKSAEIRATMKPKALGVGAHDPYAVALGDIDAAEADKPGVKVHVITEESMAAGNERVKAARARDDGTGGYDLPTDEAA